MNLTRKPLLVYLLLAILWPAMVGWLVFEHKRVRNQARALLLHRARDISNTIALLTRSGRFNVIPQSWLESSLTELTRSGELISVVLLNSQGDEVASAGPPLPYRLSDVPKESTRWSDDNVMVINLVNFGTLQKDQPSTAPLAIVLPNQDEQTSATRRFFPPRPDRERDRDRRPQPPGPPPPGSQTDEPGMPPPPPREGMQPRPPFHSDGTSSTTAATTTTTQTAKHEGPFRERRNIFRKPSWMSQSDYESILRERGLHGFVLVLSTANMNADLRRDLWLRFFLGSIGMLAVGGLGLAWHGLLGSTRLQVRLMRAQEINTHLREMNLAAAGLAHETRNPLNIVRGLAQLVVQSPELPPDVRDRALQITEEVDRVTVRLNEFINYSRPLEPRPAPVEPRAILQDVTRALESDCAEKGLSIQVEGPPLSIYGDELLLRQVLFNLLLNAVQSVPAGGVIRARIVRDERGEASLLVEDNGPGVAPGDEAEIFRPYFTTRAQGSGLGLAVVRQIALAHRWEIDYFRNDLGGATFRLQGLTIVQPTA